MPDDDDAQPEDADVTCSGSITLPRIGASNDTED